MIRSGLFPLEKSVRLASRARIVDENGDKIVSNWPRVFGPGIEKQFGYLSEFCSWPVA